MDCTSDLTLNLEKDEYEVHLYGFSLSDFKKENYRFLQKTINKSMQFMYNKFINMIKSSNPQLIAKISQSTKEIEKRIIASCNANIETILNEEIEKSLSIPDNVILPQDKIYVNVYSKTEIDELKKEVDNFYKLSTQYAAFINYLNSELQLYNLENCIQPEDKAFETAEHYLNNVYDTNILKNIVKKLEDTINN